MVIIAVLAVYLVVHERYEDGVVGRIALGGLALSGMIVLIAELGGFAVYRYTPEVTLFLWAACGFFCRHVYRFIMYTRLGRYKWAEKS